MNLKTNTNFLLLLFLSTLIAISEICLAEDEMIIPVSSDNEITVEHFPSSGNYLLLWLAPEYGFRTAHRTMARLLTMQQIEVWQSNIVESLFLPQGAQSIKQLDGQYVADLIEYAHKATGKKIILAGDSYAAISALLGAHQWQQRKQSSAYLIGAVLFSPYTYAYIPPLGLPPEYLPIISATNIPIMIYQAQGSGSFGQFEQLLDLLQQHNNPVYSKFVPDVMSLFYLEQPTKEMKTNAESLAPNIKQMITVLEKHKLPLAPVLLKKNSSDKSGIDVFLKEFKGNNTPLPISSNDTNGKSFNKNSYKGQVTLINFWATWCPPCVEEIPSLNRLKAKMSNEPFELISINYAEENEIILDFMKKINVQFPVLMDPDGAFSNQWQVLTFPSTFVIAADGKIKYGVNAAIEWDDPEVIKKLKALMKNN